MGNITIANKHHLKCDGGKDDFYIGRGSPLGNPYPITATATREAVIDRYRFWLREKLTEENHEVLYELNRIARRVMDGKPVRLICFCAPKPCHGDVIKKTILDAIANAGD